MSEPTEEYKVDDDLTFDMRGKTDEELWDLVREACRPRSDWWRAFEELRSRFVQAKTAVDHNYLLREGLWPPKPEDQ